ncbi:MAG TPA: VOC family protein [Candidatus Lumbricidophila sp.]|nr:VOC family protein [Candidatus Lumbricidophila sp.]
MQQIIPSLWFDDRAEEAMNYYVNAIPNSRIVDIKRYPEGMTEGPMAGMGGKVLNGQFVLNGQPFTCLDGGPIFTFNESISFMLMCDDQNEVDRIWAALSAVPESEQCGWCKDQFGLSWQVIPTRMGELLSDPDPVASGRALQAMLQMKKIDVAALEAAFRGE